jgi:hypothetical protein
VGTVVRNEAESSDAEYAPILRLTTGKTLKIKSIL